jgi:hypothetical protein
MPHPQIGFIYHDEHAVQTDLRYFVIRDHKCGVWCSADRYAATHPYTYDPQTEILEIPWCLGTKMRLLTKEESFEFQMLQLGAINGV